MNKKFSEFIDNSKKVDILALVGTSVSKNNPQQQCSRVFSFTPGRSSPTAVAYTLGVTPAPNTPLNDKQLPFFTPC